MIHGLVWSGHFHWKIVTNSDRRDLKSASDHLRPNGHHLEVLELPFVYSREEERVALSSITIHGPFLLHRWSCNKSFHYNTFLFDKQVEFHYLGPFDVSNWIVGRRSKFTASTAKDTKTAADRPSIASVRVRPACLLNLSSHIHNECRLINNDLYLLARQSISVQSPVPSALGCRRRMGNTLTNSWRLPFNEPRRELLRKIAFEENF